MRLIDADALMGKIDFEYDLNYGETLIDPRGFADMVGDAPTIEAEPVVRCKDCKYSKKFNITGNRYCEFHGAYEYPVSDDDYCSNGEKMDLEG